MGKEYNAVTTQVAVLQTQTKTLSVYCNLQPAPLNRFAELVNGTVRIAIQDFSAGKGDKSKFVYFNMSLNEINDLNCCVNCMSGYTAQKIYGKYPEKDGPYAGKCKSFRFFLQYIPKMPDGSDSNNPYSLTIKNGYAVAASGKIPGSFYEKSNSFVEKASVTLRMNYPQISNILRNVLRYIDVFSYISGQSLIPKGLQALEKENAHPNDMHSYQPEHYNQSEAYMTNQSQYPNTENYTQYQNVTNQDQYQNNVKQTQYKNRTTQNQYSNAANQSQYQDTGFQNNTSEQSYAYMCMIRTIPVATGEGYMGSISIDERDYPCIFDIWHPIIEKACTEHAPCALTLKNINGKLHCIGLAS